MHRARPRGTVDPDVVARESFGRVLEEQHRQAPPVFAHLDTVNAVAAAGTDPLAALIAGDEQVTPAQVAHPPATSRTVVRSVAPVARIS